MLVCRETFQNGNDGIELSSLFRLCSQSIETTTDVLYTVEEFSNWKRLNIDTFDSNNATVALKINIFNFDFPVIRIFLLAFSK